MTLASDNLVGYLRAEFTKSGRAYRAHRLAADEIREVRHRLTNADKAGYPLPERGGRECAGERAIRVQVKRPLTRHLR